MQAVGNTDSLFKTPVQAQGCPEGVVNQALAPRADLRPKRLRVLTVDLLRLRLASGINLCRALLPQHVLAPEHEELEEDVPEPATGTPDVPFVDAAVFLDKPLRHDAL